MFSILILALFGLVVGLLARMLHPGDDKIGCLPTILIGVFGSFVGGGINWLIGMGNEPFSRSGFLMSVVGGIICCAAWRWYTLKTSKDGPKSFFTGKKLQ